MVKKADEKEFVFSCKVTLRGAQMIVRAKDEEEARTKAMASSPPGWEDITYETAELVDWEVTNLKPR